MKTNSILKITITLLFIVATITSCVKDDDFDTPQIANCEDINNINPNYIKTITQIAANYTGSTHVFNDADPVYMEGFVVTSDASGNFYHEIWMQDKAENPTIAIRLEINTRSLYTQYAIGNKILVNLNGLVIDKIRGELSIGELNNGAFDGMRTNIAEKHIIRTCDNQTLIPIEITSSSNINTLMIGLFVQLTESQFPSSNNSDTFVDPNDSFDTSKNIILCEDFSTITMENSTFASYGNTSLPMKKGNVTGIITRNYSDNYFVFKINSANDFDYNIDQRCEIQFCNPDCTDSFDGGLSKWTTYSVVGDQEWDTTTFGNPGPSAKITGHVGGSSGTDYENEDWLISTAIDLSSISSTILFNFESARAYGNSGSDANIDVYYSVNYSGGNPTTDGNWVQLNPTLDTNTSGFGSSTWTNSGDLDVSSAAGGNLYVAFKYTSSNSNAPTFEIDNVSINY